MNSYLKKWKKKARREPSIDMTIDELISQTKPKQATRFSFMADTLTFNG